MAMIVDMHINRECEDCIHGEYDLMEQKYYCNLREEFRDPQEADPCPDIQTY
jgi:hypothetical protein